MSRSSETDQLTTRLLDAHVRIYLACTGAGAGLQQQMWSVPGSSAFLIGAEFPYGREATERFLGFRPEKAVSVETAVDLALEAYARACTEGGFATTAEPVGLGLTASVATTKVHRGDHRICTAVATRRGVWVADRLLDKSAGRPAREADGQAADHIGLGLILHALGLGLVDGVRAEPGVDAETVVLPGVGPTLVCDASALARRRFFARGFHAGDGRRLAATPETLGYRHIFSGAFNPPHEGHFAIADTAARVAGGSVVFAVTADAPHKPPVQLAELIERAALLRGRDRMFTEGDALYLDKARRYPGRAFALGADAFQRLLDPKWGPAVEPMLREFAQLGTSFLVFGRLVDGVWMTRDDVLRELSRSAGSAAAGAAASLSRALEGRWDVSSSELRAAEASWRRELERRVAEVDSGAEPLLSWDEFRRARDAQYDASARAAEAPHSQRAEVRE